ncbi:MAG: PPOX class F420-dependent oxidoreductase [Candidatus Limnocylindrales bacterium]
MSVFTAAELAYLAQGHLGRLATLGPDGSPHVVPVGVFYDAERDVLAVGGRGFATSRKFCDARLDPRVAIVVDDAETTPTGARLRMLEVRGTAEVVAVGGSALRAGFDEPFIRIHATRIVAMGLDHDDRIGRGREVD